MPTPPWSALADHQAGALARRQLRALGIDSDRVRNQLTAGRWVTRGPRVVSTVTGPASPAHRMWVGLLHAGPDAVLGGLSSLQLQGLQGWERQEVTVLVPADGKVPPLPGYRFQRTRRSLDDLVVPGRAARYCRAEAAALLTAADLPSERAAAGLVAAVVQQGLADASALAGWVERLVPLRRSAVLRRCLDDIAGGSQSLAELDLVRACRRFGLVQPRRQVARTDAAGRRRWTDAEWTLPDGRTLVLEVDGGFHVDVGQWRADIARQRSLAQRDVVLVRCTAVELRSDPAAVVRDLRALGVPEVVGRMTRRSAS